MCISSLFCCACNNNIGGISINTTDTVVGGTVFDTKNLKLAKADPINFEVHLLYKDHLIIHSYLTLCTDLDKIQEKYESQADLRKQNSQIGVAATNQKKKTKQSVVVSHKKSLINLKQFYSDEEIDDILNL